MTSKAELKREQRKEQTICDALTEDLQFGVKNLDADMTLAARRGDDVNCPEFIAELDKLRAIAVTLQYHSNLLRHANKNAAED